MKYIILLCITLFWYSVNAQLYIGSGSSWKSDANTIVVLDNLGIQYDAASATLDNIFKFTGNADANISGSSLPIFTKIELAKTGTAKVVLQRNTELAQSLNFQSGLFDLNGFVLDMQTNALFENESETSRMMGSDGYARIVADLNAPNSVNPGNLGALITSTQNLGSTTITRGVKSQTNINNGGNSILRYYNIAPANNNALNGTLRFTYLDAELNGLTENALDMYKSVNGTDWADIGYDSRNVALNYVGKSGLNDFSLFTLSSTGNALPLTFLSFITRCESNYVNISWETAQELNLRQYSIQRSYDGVHWESIATKIATGNNVSLAQHYTFMDQSSQNEDALYRIEAMDYDGKTQYTLVSHSGCFVNGGDIKVWPNPVHQIARISIASAQAGKASIQLFDAKGSLISTGRYSTTHTILLDMSKLASGIYHLKAEWDNGNKKKTAVIIKE